MPQTGQYDFWCIPANATNGRFRWNGCGLRVDATPRTFTVEEE